MRMQTAFVVLTLALAPTGAAFATDYYAVPDNTVESCTPDGSQACPWIGATTALSAILKAGSSAGTDTLFLEDGNYNGLALYDYNFDHTVVVQSLNGKNAHLEYIWVKDLSQNMTFKNLSVWPSDPVGYFTSYPYNSLVTTYSTSANILFDGLDIRSTQDAANYMSWSQSDWLSHKINGASISGPNNVLQNSTITGIYFGAIEYANASMINNVVNGFSADAYRVLGDNSLVDGNVAENCFQIDGNHADALQSFNNTGNPGSPNLINNVTIKNNYFIEWNSTQTNPLRCSLQGIFMGNGPYQNIVIQNNLVSVTAGNGIGIDGGQNVQIVNNTVVNNAGTEGTTPYIIVNNISGPVQNTLVANNLAMSLIDKVGGVGITYSDNSNLVGLSTLFQDISTYNYYPTPASGFIDTANPAYAPATDITGAPRPYGKGPDRGAYEVGATAPSSTGGGSPTGAGVKMIAHGTLPAKFLSAPPLNN